MAQAAVRHHDDCAEDDLAVTSGQNERCTRIFRGDDRAVGLDLGDCLRRALPNDAVSLVRGDLPWVGSGQDVAVESDDGIDIRDGGAQRLDDVCERLTIFVRKQFWLLDLVSPQ